MEQATSGERTSSHSISPRPLSHRTRPATDTHNPSTSSRPVVTSSSSSFPDSAYHNWHHCPPLEEPQSHYSVPQPSLTSYRASNKSRRSPEDSDSEDTLVSTPQSQNGPYCDSSFNLPREGMTSPDASSYYHPSDSHSTLPTYEQRKSDGRPLIDLVTNEWANKPYDRHTSFDSEDSYTHFMNDKEGFPSLPNWMSKISFPRRVQRYLFAYLLFLIACWFTWLFYLEPAWAQERLLDATLLAANQDNQTFGTNIRPEFSDMIHLQNLESELVPGIAKQEDRRLVFVGDVHGCKDELQKLLDKVKFVKGKDHLILTGDLVAKGPASPGAIDLAIELGASCVRGNWEDRTLLAYNSLVAKVHPLPGPQEDPNTQEDYLDEESFSHGDYKDRAMAKLLSKRQIDWLQRCPVILRVGAIPAYNGGGEIIVVHAGMAPGVDLDRQDPFLVMNMRTIDLMTRVPSEERTGEPWENLWNHHQSHVHPPSERTTIIYGHDSKRGLNIQKYSKGLDSLCVKGGELTALVLDQRGKQKIVSVKCSKYKD